MGSFFCAFGPLGAGFVHQELDVLGHQFLDPMVAVNGGLEAGHLLRGHVAGDVAAVFIRLVIVVGALRALAKDTDGAAIQRLDLGDVLEERLWSGFGIHGRKYMCMAYTKAIKKGRKTQVEEIRPPPAETGAEIGA